MLDLADPDAVIERTEGVTASFLKELLRRAALFAADEPGQEEDASARSGSPTRTWPPPSTSCSIPATSSPGCCSEGRRPRQRAAGR